MIVIGVTGGFGTGKTSVSRMFGKLGAVVLDADEIAHDAIAYKKPAWQRIVRRFGTSILDGSNEIDSRRLAGIVFKEPASRKSLEKIVHPVVKRVFKQRLRELSKKPGCMVAVIDVPLLIEAGMGRFADELVVVTASSESVRRRLIKKGFFGQEIKRRQKAQLDIKAKVALADYVIDNSDGLEHTRTQVRRIWQQVSARCRKKE
jgi:dephospho-CoA kinase